MSLTLARKFDRPAKTERGLIRKINRLLAPSHYRLHKARPHNRGELGEYYIVDEYRNGVIGTHIPNLQMFLDCLEEDLAAA